MPLLVGIVSIALWLIIDLWLGIKLNNSVKSKLKPIKVK